MNDRELLELAARAAGLRSHWFFGEGQGLQVSRKNEGHRFNWNPLTDDGDALRLAVKLNFTVSICDEFTKVTHGFEEGIIEYADGHKERATRMAIVRAAAEIGKSMGGGE
ncbi:hypothetical protein R4J99_04195 [Pseudomonas aeruginosa]|uniref:hypothetical protein n=1 Tax=Pseudomonas aeruginosa TaxID=287 RepID=UPI0029531982|nr:hypothetical protein [Pseudomonas aeruginosa]MDV7894732.1 hypothetical protein [Pseudomonas aeruginosa]